MSLLSTITIIQGTNRPRVGWQFLSAINPDVLYPLSGKDIYMVIGRTQEIIYSRNSIVNPGSFTIDLINSTVAWVYSVADTFLFPSGDGIVSYRVEWRIGSDQGLLVSGLVNVKEGPDAS